MPYGVTPEMAEAYGKVIFELSLNVQVRKGDPIRKLDHAAWLAEREATGLADDEIADRVGLARPQVTFIRNVIERRIFRTNQYRKLYRLGGGKRYRADEYVDPEEAFRVKPDAALIRRALAFDEARVRTYIESGAWTGTTLADRLKEHARERPDTTAVRCGEDELSWSEFHARAHSAASEFARAGIGRGDAVGIAAEGSIDSLTAIAGAWLLGCPVLILPQSATPNVRAEIAHRGRLAAVITDRVDELAELREVLPTPGPVLDVAAVSAAVETSDVAQRLIGPVAGDPAVLLAGPAVARSTELVSEQHIVAHTHHTVLAAARAFAGPLPTSTDPGTATAVSWDGGIDEAGFAVVLAYWLDVGATLTLGRDPGEADNRSVEALRFAPGEAPVGMVLISATRPGGTEVNILGTRAVPCVLVRVGAGAAVDDGVWRGLPASELRIADAATSSNGMGILEARSPSAAAAVVDDPIATSKIFVGEGWARLGLQAAPAANGDFSIRA